MDNCWISCQVMADMKKVYDDLILLTCIGRAIWKQGHQGWQERIPMTMADESWAP